MGTTKKPTGMSVTRKNNKFTCSWKIPEKYNDGQQIYYRVKRGTSKSGYKWGHFDNGKFVTNGDGWKKLSCTHTTKNKSVELSLSNYYPNSGKKCLSKVQFKVRGKHEGDKWSAFEYDTFDVEAPKKPSVSEEAVEGYTNSTKFSWTLNSGNTATSKAYFTQLQWESILLKDSNITSGKEAFAAAIVSGSKQTGTATTSSSQTITEASIADGSYTRWFRARSSGPQGYSDWVYTKHIYAAPNQAKNVVPDADENSAGGYNVVVGFTTETSVAIPTDSTTLQYAKVVPASGLTYPSTASSAWENGTTVAYRRQNDEVRFSVSGGLDTDECLWVRVNTTHNGITTEGAPEIAQYGVLATPTITSLSTNDTTHKVTISATNNCTVPDSYLGVYYQGSTDPAKVIGIIPAGETTLTAAQCPNWSTQTTKSFGVFAVVGTASYITKDSVKEYSFTPYSGKQLMTSATTWQGGTVPAAPTGVTVSATSVPDVANVKWNWTWSDADAAEISWSDNPDAWESTSEPETYHISHIQTGNWNIADLTPGTKYYIRVRLIADTGENAVYGPYSERKDITLSTAPNVPTMVLSTPVVKRSGNFTASWAYVTGDGTPQAYAEICEATISNGAISYGSVIAHTTTAQNITLYPAKLGWAVNTTHNLCVRVTSGSNARSDGWSAPVPIKVANPLTCAISYSTGSNLAVISVPDDDVDGTTKSQLSLLDMPLTVTVTGAGDFGTTTLAIEREEAYFLDRPDEKEVMSHAGETVALEVQTGADAIVIDNDDLMGTLDDGAAYKFIATVSDSLGQKAEAELPFEVHWTEQAKMPSGTVSIDDTNLVAFITPSATNPGTGDTCDIYRLSADRPVLVYEGATFGTTYVDPFPTIGEYGGHRLVYKTENGDYTTADNELAWIDLTEADGDRLDTMYNIIDFGGDRVQLMYDIQLSTTWEKDFTATQYLGGAIQGDWNPAVMRTGTVSSRVVTIKDQETIEAMRRLADYAGICHVRTRDGSSYPANVNVNEEYDMGQEIIARTFKVSITRVDPEVPDGQTYADWIEG